MSNNPNKGNNTHASKNLRDHITLNSDRMYFISDLHIGDGSQSEALNKKTDLLISFLRKVQEENAQLIIVGDGLDFHQSFHGITAIVEGNAKIISQLRNMDSFHYIQGNHDYDIQLLRGLIDFELHHELIVDNQLHVLHGHEYDPYISTNLEESHLFTVIHHLTERILNCRFRLPLENAYNLENRCAFWLFHKLVIGIETWSKLTSFLGWKDRIKGWRDFCQHWAMNQISDPANIFENVRKECSTSKYPFLITGHSHLPGQITFENGNSYVNTGSWTLNSAQYACWDGTKIEVRDFDSGKIYKDEMYQRLNTRLHNHLNFLTWWQENYMGWLRFRNAELRRYPSTQ